MGYIYTLNDPNKNGSKILAKKYGVNPHVIWCVVTHRTWKEERVS